MTSYFAYPCPGCRTTNNLHEPECRFSGTEWHEIERAYTAILSVLSAEPCAESTLREAVDGRWSGLHAAALEQLQREHRVREAEGVLELLTPEERKERVSTPTHDPVKTIYEEGSVPGCHDNSVFALIAWFEMVGLDWPETRENVIEWLHESGTWARGGFEESSPEELVDSKRHVHEEGYGWKEKAVAAKRVIDGH
ncbi:DUF7474 family protein [Natranaeroarchaeum aerophilus]|uniref:Uncharacterized protein n=1 Tax=Natranaeroarchaeum aerophilus TaxID=2917711 RepID=A0AAE3K331_9EURY|nr:hypothetical protein [Natranaeroarchaeum aerophilus]MCL9812352.1 hypothetical protein [Natranaeroarchaeum aerophilus]